MSYKQKIDPVYEVSCDRCHLTKVVASRNAAYLSGFREITITIGGSDKADLFASVTLWMCEKCNDGFFNQAIKPYLSSLFAPK